MRIWSFNPSQVQFTLLLPPAGRFLLNRFQSLTGSIHTKALFGCKFVRYAFQSLTGSIHTLCPLARATSMMCFNPSQVQFTLEVLGNTRSQTFGFNPSQVQFTQFQNKAYFVVSCTFQSLTGSIHTYN